MEIIKIKSLKDLNKLKKDSILESENPKLIRKALESKKFLAITGIENENNKDRMHSQNSNFNNVLAKIAVKNKIAYSINMEKLIKSKDQVSLLRKIYQNIKLCNKHKVKIYILNNHNKNPKDLESFSRFLKIKAEMIKC